MRRGLCGLLCLGLISGANGGHAQALRVFTVLVESGGQVVKLLLEKRSDLAIGILSGAVVTVGDHVAMSAFHSDKAEAKESNPCLNLSASVVSCAKDLPVTTQRTASVDEIQNAMSKLRATTLIEAAPKSQANPFLFKPSRNITFFSHDMVIDRLQPKANDLVTPSQIAKVTAIGEVVYWFSIQDSTNVADYREYLHRYPLGPHASIALDKIKSLTPPPPPPPPVQVQLPCPKSEAAIMEPVQQLYRATSARDIDWYGSQLFDQAVFRDFDGRYRRNKTEWLGDRSREFASWKSATMHLLRWKVTTAPNGEATVRSEYAMDIEYPDGFRAHQESVESYTMGCAVNGLWRVVENIDYSH